MNCIDKLLEAQHEDAWELKILEGLVLGGDFTILWDLPPKAWLNSTVNREKFPPVSAGREEK